MKYSPLSVLACLPLLAIGLAPAREPAAPATLAPSSPSAPLAATFSGYSAVGNLQEALDEALQAAQQSRDGSGVVLADGMINWRLSDVYGVRGGILGLEDLWVDVVVVR